MIPYKRSIFLINKKFQLRFSFYVCSWLFALSIVYPLIIYNLFELFIRKAAVDPSGPPVSSLQATRYQIILLLVVLQLVFLLLTFLISIFVSHRIAGPLYKLTQFFKKANPAEKIRFRKGDHFQDLAESYNEMMAKIQARQASAASKIQRALSSQSPSREDLQAALAELTSSQGPTEAQQR